MVSFQLVALLVIALHTRGFWFYSYQSYLTFWNKSVMVPCCDTSWTPPVLQTISTSYFFCYRYLPGWLCSSCPWTLPSTLSCTRCPRHPSWTPPVMVYCPSGNPWNLQGIPRLQLQSPQEWMVSLYEFSINYKEVFSIPSVRA